MWRDLRADVDQEFANLSRALSDTQQRRASLLSHGADDSPDSWDRRAAAFAIHECYGGIENVLKRIALAVDRAVPSGGSWHVELVRQLSGATPLRPAVVSARMVSELRECLGFRHVARTHYGFDLDWTRLRTLLERMPTLIADFSAEVEAFLHELDQGTRRQRPP